MKKFFALFAMVACLGMMNVNAQSIVAIGTPNAQGKLVLWDSLSYKDLDPSKNYDFNLYLVLSNNSAADFVLGDTIGVSLTMNDAPAFELSLNISKTWQKDSALVVSLKGLAIPAKMFKEGEYANTICAAVTKAYTNNSYKNVEDRGFCSHISVTFANVGIAENEMEAINVYPNPVRNSLTIENANNVNVNIYAANGQMVKTFVANGTTTVNMNDLSNGLYIVKMQGENATRVEKVQVVR